MTGYRCCSAHTVSSHSVSVLSGALRISLIILRKLLGRKERRKKGRGGERKREKINSDFHASILSNI